MPYKEGSLPHTLLEDIFSLIPYRHLLLICSRVCKSWSGVILNSTYLPFRVLYHHLIWDSHTLFQCPLLGDKDGDLSLHNASYIVEKLCCEYHIDSGSDCMRGILEMMEKRMKNWSRIGQENDDSRLFELLHNHPLYTSIIKSGALKNKNCAWSLVTAIAMLSRDTNEILQLLKVLLGMYPATTIMDIFYSYAIIFLFCSNLCFSNVHHYKVHAALYLIENNIIHHKPEQIISCEQALLINHFPRASETICVEYVPGVDIVDIVLKMVRRHSNLQYFIVNSQSSSTSPLLQLPPNAVCSLSIGDCFSFDVLVLMPDSMVTKGDYLGKGKEMSIITFRNVLSNEEDNNNGYYSITIVYPLMLSVKNQDLCWIMYSVMIHKSNIKKSYRSIPPVSTETHHLDEKKSCNEMVLVICLEFLNMYSLCYDCYCNDSFNDFCIITVDEKLENFLDEVLEYPLFINEIHKAAYSISKHRTDDFITWLKPKCSFIEYHPRFNVIMFMDMLPISHTMPSFSLVRLYRGYEIEIVPAIINNLTFNVLEIPSGNFFEEANINTVFDQLATYDEINRHNNAKCVCCKKNLKGEYLALKHVINSVGMVAVKFTCFNSSEFFICAQCAILYRDYLIYDVGFNIFNNLEHLEFWASERDRQEIGFVTKLYYTKNNAVN